MGASRSGRPRRRGATAVEFALVAPVIVFLIFIQIAGGLGIARYHEVAHLAREGARYASTHGGMYLREGTSPRTGVPAVSTSDDLRAVLEKHMAFLDPSRTEIRVSWTVPSHYSPPNMPFYVDIDPTLIPPAQRIIKNEVIVTVTYHWIPEVFSSGPVTLTSTSQMPMSY